MTYLIKMVSISFLFFLSLVSQAQDGKQLYTTYCAGCHGASLEGTTSAATLIKAKWKNGSGADVIKHSIKNGVPNTTMIAWGSLLDDKQIDAITSFIVSSQTLSSKPSISMNEIEVINSKKYSLTIEKLVTENLQTPWAIEFISSDTALISEKKGGLKWLIHGKLSPQEIKGLPKPHLVAKGTGGFMDIALDPNYEQNGWVYLAFSHTNGDVKNKYALALTKIVRGKIVANEWIDQQTLFEVPDSLKVVNGDRWGCRLLFDKEGFLYFSIGDMGKAMDSQNLGKATGKVFRIHSDGSIPKDNPFVDEEGALKAIYAIGLRNVQGISQHPVTEQIWVTDHGPKGGDELNVLEKGGNYGWPVITYGINYDGSIITDKTHQEGMEQPIVQWTPSIAVCPSGFCASPLFEDWKNNLLVGALAFQELRRLVIIDDKVVGQEIIFKGKGRVRDVKFGKDGALYILTNSPDEVLKITPKPR
ncbi:PQQ-dependent sugar dehydrogenase [Flammeovirgaceae bacterium SG7u.111]|nr:PQQ-dependent sugar dehydrogenase [Flammeovirgaceae bacterium SG7u.132]WPO37657.1 PQQ-dependent sugar dehydrogenase [Flammeovirgaceae bacterium SG7u.111]